MTTREYFLKTLGDEQMKFRNVIEALPDDKFSHKVHEKSREAGNLAAQIAMQWEAISGILTKGAPAFDSHAMGALGNKEEMLKVFDRGFEQLKKDAEQISEESWENDSAVLDM